MQIIVRLIEAVERIAGAMDKQAELMEGLVENLHWINANVAVIVELQKNDYRQGQRENAMRS